MSKFVSDQLTGPLLSRLSIDTAIDQSHQAYIVCTLDEHGWPHPAMLSSLEVVALDARNIRLATYVTSRTTRNLKANGKLTLILADERAVYYIKGDVLLLAASLATSPENAKFNFRVDSILEDSPAPAEHARVLSGVRIDRRVDNEHALAMLRELLTD